jgi:PAS domain S-box-containing protein
MSSHDPTDESRPGQPPSPSSLRGHVLIADDHAALADNLRELLAIDDPELEITVVGRGGSALDVARTRGFDVAIVDVQLPDGSGVEFLPLLKSAAPLGEVVLITGYATIDAAIAALRAGAYALLLKSFRPEELRTTVRQALVKVALRRERDQLERRYRALVGAADVVVVAIDRDGHAALVNPKFTALTGSDPDAARRTPIWSRVVAADRDRFREALHAVAADGAPRELEAGLVASEGEPRLLRWHLSGEPDGQDALVFGIGVDVTERRALEKRAAAAEALSAMGTLALGLAHEIRNPLNAAVLQMHLLGRQVERAAIDAETQASMGDRVRIVVGEIKRLARLLTEFLELARPRGLHREAVPIDELIASVVELHLEEARAKHVSLRLASARSTPAAAREPTVGAPREARVRGDREKLKQVLVNLLVNALEASPPGATVQFSTSVVDDRVRIELRDEGSGISEEDRGRLFDPFFTTKPGGTGLGLSIVRKILDQHEGAIEVRSQPGEGTVVVVALPLAPHDAASD